MTPALPRNAEEYLSWLDVERGRSPRTLASYRRDLASYQAFVAQRGSGAVIDTATPAVVAAYVASLRRTRSGATVARSLSTLRGFHRFLVEEGEAAIDPTADIPGVAVADLLPKALSEDETGRLLGAVVGTGPAMLRDRALLELLYGTGARVSEVVGLNLGDVAEAVDLGGTPLIRVLGKGSKERVVPLGRLARDALQQWLSGEGRPHLEPKKWKVRSDADAVFLNARGGRSAWSRSTPTGSDWRTGSALTSCATRAPPTCCPGGPTSVSSRSSWVTPPWPPPSATPRCRRSICVVPTRTPTPARVLRRPTKT
jgi:integrase/recombinase XerD